MRTLPPASVYLVAESACHAATLTRHLSTDARFSIRVFATAQACRGAVQEAPPVLVVIATDFGCAAALVATARQIAPAATVLAVASAEEASGVAAPALLRAGLAALLPADEHAAGLLAAIARRAVAAQAPAPAAFVNLIGESEPMQVVFRLIRKAAASSITVSLRGETGTGKEEAALAIHAASARASAPFVALNMAAVPRELLESELFGHEKGAFTGALTTRVGHFELAANGTLFLDEIADLDLGLQAKLLRVLQERTFTRVGGTRALPLRARLIVATHAELPQCVRVGTFREDLYYRLLGLPITLPPLRVRDGDVLLLARRFLHEFCPPGSGRPGQFSAAAEQRLLAHSYPGNVRELRAVIELAAVLTDGEQIEADDLVFPPGMTRPAAAEPLAFDPRLTLRQHVAVVVQRYLDHYQGDVQAVAGHLDIGKSTLYRMIQSGEISSPPA